MGKTKEMQTQAVLDAVAGQDAGPYEWWTVLDVEDGDLALEPDPIVVTDSSVDELELRLYSL